MTRSSNGRSTISFALRDRLAVDRDPAHAEVVEHVAHGLELHRGDGQPRSLEVGPQYQPDARVRGLLTQSVGQCLDPLVAVPRAAEVDLELLVVAELEHHLLFEIDRGLADLRDGEAERAGVLGDVLAQALDPDKHSPQRADFLVVTLVGDRLEALRRGTFGMDAGRL